MRKLILQMQTSVDGRVASDDGGCWQVWGWGDAWPWDESLKRDFNATLQGVGCILMSRPMIEQGYLDHWMRMAKVLQADPHGGFARRIGEVEKVVLSNTLSASRWPRTTMARGPIPEAVGALKLVGAGDIICFGGAGFASALVAAGVVDEYQFYVNPTAVGSGDSIFRVTSPLRLIGSRSYECGIVVNRYTHAGPD
ncbi:dihydrofolate reductase family protein [Variovorax sp. YR216]|uniref:dihydrofolate reductase family protein n=1 Tax=Variovorax sp. YR216 TaxID=1882828 RepID=UPI00089CCA01|nr:dihydrofolate reductase family protein [Variovorax sp. YR216]SEB23657.1 Dihydrofolate reductase [Variovorax sp. YR216]